MLDWDSLRVAARGVDTRPYFDNFPGLVSLVSERNLYIPESVRVVYATLCISDGKNITGFMFREKCVVVGLGFIAKCLGVELVDNLCLHSLAWPRIPDEAEPPRQALSAQWHTDDQIRNLFVQLFLSGTPRIPNRLTPVPLTIHNALRKSLLYRKGNGETITGLQQWLLLSIMNGEQFDLVHFMACEMEEAIFYGMTVVRL
ncbi:unnamed protein product [Urochloa humidicola]